MKPVERDWESIKQSESVYKIIGLIWWILFNVGFHKLGPGKLYANLTLAHDSWIQILNSIESFHF